MAGYSKTPLAKKLGLQNGLRAHFRHAPDSLPRALGELPPGLQTCAALRGRFDFIHAFYDSRRRLLAELPILRRALRKSGALWISWPKKASGSSTDLSGGDVRSIGLDHGLVDVKVCAVDEVWSGLKFVYRRAER